MMRVRLKTLRTFNTSSLLPLELRIRLDLTSSHGTQNPIHIHNPNVRFTSLPCFLLRRFRAILGENQMCNHVTTHVQNTRTTVIQQCSQSLLSTYDVTLLPLTSVALLVLKSHKSDATGIHKQFTLVIFDILVPVFEFKSSCDIHVV